MELYFVTSSGTEGGSDPRSSDSASPNHDGNHAVGTVLSALKFSPNDIGHNLYLHCERAAVRHLFRVASSLDSLVIGEPQILGQLKHGFELARTAHAVGSILNRVSMRAFRTAKRVRSETTIGKGQVSVATVALDLAGQIFDRLEGRTVALIGTGEMGETIARLFQQAGAKLVVLGRNEARVKKLAQMVGSEGRLMSELDRTLDEACVVVTSTSATEPVIEYERVRAAMRRRRGRDLFFVDVAVPRDVDEKVGKLDGVYLYNVDDLASVVEGSQSHRRESAQRAEAIVEEELVEYERREDVAQVSPMLCALYTSFQTTLRGEVERSLAGKLRELSENERKSLECLSSAATKKLLHRSAVTLKRWAVERPEELATAMEVVRALFLQENAESRDSANLEARPLSSKVSEPEAKLLTGECESSIEDHQ
jgi:glutamyl-tRNA reductase